MAALAALLLAGCGGSSHRHGATRAADSLPPAAARAPAGAATISAPPPLTPLQSALGRLFGKDSPSSGGAVYDLTDHSQVFELNSGVGRPPASVEKLYTTVAALSGLGPAATFQTTMLGAGHLAPGGVWLGDLYLRGGGDPTFGDDTFNRLWNHGLGASAGHLIAQLHGEGITRVTGRVIPDESLFDPARGGPSSNFAPDVADLGGQLSALTYDHGATSGPGAPGLFSPPAFAVNELTMAMRAQHIVAWGTHVTAITPRDAQLLAAVTSPPVSTLVRLMDVPSDDLFAEILTKQLGVKLGGAGTTVAGANVIASIISTYGVHPTIVDGSGLSRADTSSPGQVVALLREVWHTEVGDELIAALPVVGVNGTVQAIGVHTPAHGRCVAKTGTLNGVTNLAGYCTNRAGHVLAFALFIDGPPNWVADKTLGKMVGAIAT
jgi:D-alanyl-D-alanine carboxypeptidase/D-alanyl-D-alanine-endopeptidase (penicillin-binding protein 4)